MSVVNVEQRGELAIVTLNRPDQMNALSVKMREKLAEIFDDLEANEAVRVVILTGAGRAFCAGLDLKELGSGSAGVRAQVEGDIARDPVKSIGCFTGPVIGAINGVAITGGFEVALACDVLIASTNARFADTHGRVGLVPGWGLSQKLSRAVGISRAKELSLTGNFLSAEQAAAWGLVNRVVAPEELLPVCEKLAGDMLSLVPGFLPIYKKVIDEGFAESFGGALELEKKYSGQFNSGVTGTDIENRRAGVQARGKGQVSR